ncbi:MAG TPA: alpha-hydroxy acid oxidase [Ignavibacteria bacterium]|nr:alpha-hydroxy acid oxidase [Ignavibacteria bacterium]HMR40854.1 alpha-hydroxy acid oxidase [Ignavibacteria bacterium]
MIPINIYDFEIIARDKLTQMAYDYYRSGSHDEITLSENIEAFKRIFLKYRVLIDVSKRDLSTEVLGQKISMPLIIAPTAFHKMAHPDGEVATAKAAGAAGTIMILSTLSNSDVEDVVKATPGPVWFQLYVYKDRAVTKELVERITKAGCKALVLTVDAPVLGTRERDVRNKFNLPEGLSVKNLLPLNKDKLPVIDDSGLAGYVQNHLDPSLSWKDIEWLKSITNLPVIIKGIACKEDAALAVLHGADGIVVSNHGGRQLDTSRATIDVLPEVSDTVNGKIEILLDGGIRRGTDILKAVALGAKAVLTGRPVLWGLGADGQAGVSAVLEIFRNELDIAMALSGCDSVKKISKDLIA